uniref:Inter-alpha-trypsin inhibitor heavy chain family member 6 n=1 Tax=Gouania willdenowi TaxID=441366 RepID=A0A8C5ESC1_GOUWI
MSFWSHFVYFCHFCVCLLSFCVFWGHFVYFLLFCVSFNLLCTFVILLGLWSRFVYFCCHFCVFFLLLCVFLCHFVCFWSRLVHFLWRLHGLHAAPGPPVLKVTDYHVKCCVVSRYAITTIQMSLFLNLFRCVFFVFILTVFREREVEKFRVAVSVPSGTRMSFLLSYEELLPRRLGRYELSLGLRPGQLVPNLTVDVSITERTGISFIKVLPLKTSRLLSNNAQGKSKTDQVNRMKAPASTRTERSSTCARIHYSPSLQQQSSISLKGLNADFNVQYDVDLKDPMGDVQVYNGYFVHYFAPRGLPVVPKDVIFVIDVSGSMIGPKIKQTKQAMGTILGDLREGDHFNIITFSDKVHTWKKGRTVRATRQNVRDAKEFVKRIIAEGWTNINAALLSAAQLLNPPSSGRQTSHRVPLVIFLTDGEATIGVTSGDTILSNAKKSLGLASLFGLAFGDDADFLLLKRLALDNRGVARIVYEDSDAALQLKGFYDEVASPLLTDIQLSYLENQAFDVTRSMFPNYFKGSELVVTGRVKPEVKDLWVSVSASDSKQRVKFENDVLVSHAKANNKSALFDCEDGSDGISSFVHRLWAYFTIKELLLAKLNTTDPVSQRLLTEKATNLSLKYNFVTQVTSLVVVKPDADEAAQTPTTAKPTTVATTTVTATTTTAVRVLAAKKSSRPNKPKPDPPQPPFNKANTNKRPLSTPATKTLVTTSKKTTTTSMDGDPHFVVQLPKLQHNLCFTVDGRANDVLRLLEDPVRVDGHLLGAPSKHGMEERSRTYFDRLTISAATGPSSDIMITLSLEGVVVEGEGRETLPINQQGSVTRQGVNVRVDNHHSCWIQLDRGVRFLVLFHQYKHPSYLQMAHLGFYITDGQGLSASTQGLLGQFQHADVSLTSVLHHKDRGQALEQGVLKWGSEHMLVTLQDKTLKDSMQKRHLGKCWVVPKAEVTRLLGHPYESYVVNYA